MPDPFGPMIGVHALEVAVQAGCLQHWCGHQALLVHRPWGRKRMIAITTIP